MWKVYPFSLLEVIGDLDGLIDFCRELASSNNIAGGHIEAAMQNEFKYEKDPERTDEKREKRYYGVKEDNFENRHQSHTSCFL